MLTQTKMQRGGVRLGGGVRLAARVAAVPVRAGNVRSWRWDDVCDPPVVIVRVSVAIHGVGVGVGCLGEALLILTWARARGPGLVRGSWN